MTDIYTQFRKAMYSAGIMPPGELQGDGLLHRFHIEGDKRGSLNGWYCLHLNGRAAGIFGSWKSGHRQTWAADGRRLDDAQRDAFAVMIRNAKGKAQAERRAMHEAAAIEARAQWVAAMPADANHPYLQAKRVKPHGLRQSSAMLLVPLYDIHGMLWNVQCIHADGTKRFRPGRAGGLFSPIGGLNKPSRLLFAEGWATGATLHEDSGNPVLCAMNAGNLLPVAQAARMAWPSAELIVCADNDRHTKGNPGVAAAMAAAKAVSAKIVIPEFPDGMDGTDFNDLRNLEAEW